MCGCSPCGGVGGGHPGPRPNTIPPKKLTAAITPASFPDQVYSLPFFANPSGGGGHVYIATLSEISTPDVPPKAELERAHVKHLADLTAAGHLAACGLTGENHGFLVLLAQSRQEAESLLRSDPLIEAKYYRTFELVELFGPAPSDRPHHASGGGQRHPK